MRRFLMSTTIALSITTLAQGQVAEVAPIGAAPSTATPPRVEVAICLDTSGSMQGLIDSAKQKLWAIVNDLALAKPTPELRVALLTFGNDGHPAAEGWVRVDEPFTTDLDAISEQLFSLTTNGGTEYVGRVLDAASRLDWTAGERTLRIAIVAGNEGADQDQEVRFRDVCPRLIADGVIVNSIYCGPDSHADAAGWRDVARLADGKYATIDKDQGTIVIETPFDDQLHELSTTLNGTYLWCGDLGQAAAANQIRQDDNNWRLNKAAAAQRARTKANGLYVNNNDLVDGLKNGALKLEEVKKEDLPEEMREMTLEEMKKHVEEASSEREELQKKINELSARRTAFVEEEMKRRALEDDASFDNAVRSAIREQASAKGFAFDGSGSGS